MKKAITAFLCLLFLFSGCSSQTPETKLADAIDYTYRNVLDPYDEGWLDRLELERISERFSIDASLYSEAAVYASDRTSRCTVLAGFCAAEGKTEELSKALQTVIENSIDAFTGYLPDQYLIAKNAEIKQYGNYIILVMTDQNEKVIKALEDCFSSEAAESSVPESESDIT